MRFTKKVPIAAHHGLFTVTEEALGLSAWSRSMSTEWPRNPLQLLATGELVPVMFFSLFLTLIINVQFKCL